MIQYHKGAFGLNLLWRLHGSAVYRAFFPGLMSIVVYLLIRLIYRDYDSQDDLGHPYAVGVLVGSVSFLIVFRANHGYQRYWEAATAIHNMMSKWMDATTHTMCFHLQSTHYDHIKPPSYHNFPELNNAFLTRNRERDISEQERESHLERAMRRSVAKSINKVRGAAKKPQNGSKKHIMSSHSSLNRELDDDASDDGTEYAAHEPLPLRGRARLDGGWQGLFPNPGGLPYQNATFFHRRKGWNSDGKGFASTAGGRTPALFLQELAHLSSLLCAVALSTLRNDIEGAESPLDVYEPGAPWPEVDPDGAAGSRNIRWPELFKNLTGADRTPEARTRYNAARPLSVIGGVSDAEIRFLQMAKGPYAKTQLCFNWLSEFITREHLSGSTGAVGAPIISRLIQFMGDGMMYYNQARKTMLIPFPFVHAQMSVFYVISMIFAVPFLMDQYAADIWIGVILTFLTVTCLAGLHEVARELENPFRNVPNDLPLCTVQAFYNEALITMYAGYHPDAYFDVEKSKTRRMSMPATMAASPKTTTTTTPQAKNAIQSIPEETSEESTGSETAESQILQLQSLIEKQGRELERLKQLIEGDGGGSRKES